MSYCNSISSNIQRGVYDLFERPLSKELSLKQRIANVVFHILTLGILLLPYKLYRYCNFCAQINSPSNPNLDQINNSPDDLQKIKEAAIEFGLNQISYYPDASGIKPSLEAVRAKSTEEKLQLLIPIFFGFQERVINAMGRVVSSEKWPNNLVEAVNDTLFIEDATCLIRIAYAINQLALEANLPQQNLSANMQLDEARTLCINTFYRLRFFKEFKTEDDTPQGRLVPENELPKRDTPEWLSLFYTPGTSQYEWMILGQNPQ